MLAPLLHVVRKIEIIILPIGDDAIGADCVTAGVAVDAKAVHAEKGVGLGMFYFGKNVKDFGIVEGFFVL